MAGGAPGLVDRAVLVSHGQGLHLSPAEVITCKSRSCPSIQVTFRGKSRAGRFKQHKRMRGCSEGSWDALLEGQEGPWVPGHSWDHFQLPEHLIFDPVCSTATGTAWLCVHTCGGDSQGCQELPGLYLPEFRCRSLCCSPSLASPCRALHFIPLLAP